MKSRFRDVIVLGYGTAAANALTYVAALREGYGYQARLIEHEVKAISTLETLCGELGVPYEQVPDRSRLTARLSGLQEETLIVSAGNYYLFPKTVIEQPRVEIINFHNALLPKIPGRNATTWAIWLDEKVSGATWHYVAPGIDDGAIIAQAEVPISEDCKAWELSRDIVAAADRAFRTFFGSLLEKHIPGRPQLLDRQTRKIYYSREMPQGGSCSWNMPAQDIYRLLRAVDYGKSDIFPPVRIALEDGSTAEIRRYSVLRQDAAGETNGDSLCLPLPEGRALKLRLRRLTPGPGEETAQTERSLF